MSDWRAQTVAFYLHRGHSLKELRELKDSDLLMMFLLIDNDIIKC